MLVAMQDLVLNTGLALLLAANSLAWPMIFFAIVALIVKGRGAIADARAAVPEVTTNLSIMAFNIAFIVPLLGILATLISDLSQAGGWALIDREAWAVFSPLVVAAIAVFVGDFVGYWRHRLEHTSWMWPSHAVHHSDTHMTWTAVERIHPINRVTTFVIDSLVLLAFGLPPYALLVNYAVRHYYGCFVHADLPWTYGVFGKIFVSPAMHRWHHAARPEAYGTNFATVFSMIDIWFGTYRVPGPCNVPLGVSDGMGTGVAGQLAHPLKISSYPALKRWRRQTSALPSSDSTMHDLDRQSSFQEAGSTQTN